jgi:hypothetical protein
VPALAAVDGGFAACHAIEEGRLPVEAANSHAPAVHWLNVAPGDVLPA